MTVHWGLICVSFYNCVEKPSRMEYDGDYVHPFLPTQQNLKHQLLTHDYVVIKD